MKAKIVFLGSAAVALSPALASGQSAPGNGQYQGTGYSHQNSGNAYGQPNEECEELIDEGEGSTPGHSASAPGGGSPFSGEDSTAGSHYAGSQPQNSRNTASVSQYDVGCVDHPQ